MASQWPPKKGVAFDLYFRLYKANGEIIANPGTYTRTIAKDGGATSTSPANAISELDTTYGRLKWTLSSSEMNADVIEVSCADDTKGCVPYTATIYTVGNTFDALLSLIAGIDAKTTNLPASPAAAGGQMDLVNAPNTTALGAIADKVLGRTLAGGADGGRTVRQALRALRNRVAFGAKMTVYREDDSTTDWEAAFTTNAAAEPITEIDPD